MVHPLIGAQTKEETYRYESICIFVSMPPYEFSTPTILCATSGFGNTRIDSTDFRAVIIIDFSLSILDLYKERINQVEIQALRGRITSATTKWYQRL